jgi:hypothetical protein
MQTEYRTDELEQYFSRSTICKKRGIDEGLQTQDKNRPMIAANGRA